jgi:hypothetical protein
MAVLVTAIHAVALRSSPSILFLWRLLTGPEGEKQLTTAWMTGTSPVMTLLKSGEKTANPCFNLALRTSSLEEVRSSL